MNALKTLERLCIHTITTKPWSIETAIEHYAAAGVSGITVWSDALEGRDPARIGRQISDAGLSTISLCRGGFFPAASEEEREKAIRQNEELIDTAAALKAPLIVLVCGADPEVGLEESRRQIVDGISRILPRATEAGVKLAVEPLHPLYADTRSAVNTIEQANEICDQINDPALGIAVDIYHLWWDPHLKEGIDRAGRADRIFAFHTCDWKYPLEDPLNDRGLMGEGCAPIRQIRGWSEAAGFDGMHEVEIFSRRYWAMDQDEYLGRIISAYRDHA